MLSIALFSMNPKLNEALDILVEECAEVIQSVCKIKRFGLNGTNPEKNKTNLDQLQHEIGDVAAMIEILQTQFNFLDLEKIEAYKKQKLEKLKIYSSIFK